MHVRWLLALVAVLVLSPVCTTEHECQICEPNTYCFVERQHQCPAHSAAPAGSDDASDCVCHAGYYLHPDEPLCVECEEDHYCPGGTTQLRMQCPPNTESDRKATHAGMCVCMPGFFHNGAGCVACAAGTVKPSAGNEECTQCGENHFSTSSLACGACPVHTQSAAGASSSKDCVAKPGAYQDKSGWVYLCPPGTFSDRANTTTCTSCPLATYQPAAGASSSTACQNCPAHSQAGAGSTALANCSCDAGYYGPAGGPCVECAAGSFKAVPGDAQCDQCAVDTYAQAGASVCTKCPVHSNAAAGAAAISNCSCAAGFGALAAPFSCVACAPGSAKLAGNAQCVPCAAGAFANESAMHSCATCLANTFSTPGSSACTRCAAAELSAPGSTSAADCECKAGYFRPQNNDTACTACPIGSYRDTQHPQSWGNLMCLPCPLGYSTQYAGSTTEDACFLCPADSYVLGVAQQQQTVELLCVHCGVNAQSSAGTADGCMCDPGFEPDAGSCAPCAYGYHKQLAGNHSCTPCAQGEQGVKAPGVAALGAAGACEPCPADTHWAAAGAKCSPCTANSEAPAGTASADGCLCKAGYELRPDGMHMACTACSPGYSKHGVSNAAFCVPCSGMLYSHSSASAVCEHCPPHSVGGVANDADVDCTCDPGFFGPDGGPCTACEVGKYKLDSGSAACVDCGPAAFWPPAADASFNRCEPCPEHSARGADLSSGVLGCVCELGYRRSADDECTLCAAGSYCPEQHEVRVCPPHSFSLPGSSSLVDCKCTAGFHGASGNCSLCPIDTFCHAEALEPTLCPANASTLGLAGRSNVSACVCLAGFYRATDSYGRDSCRECERDSFCFDNLRLACPANSSAPPGADSVSDCACHDGTAFEPRASAHVCTPCGPAQVCRGGVATSCAQGALNSHFRCVCAVGSFCQETSAVETADPARPATTCLSSCSACPPNHWCTDNQRTECGANEGAPANSSAPCRCFDGFFRNHLGACVACPLHHVCSNEQRRPVADFDTGLRTLAPQTAFLSQAVCALGLFRTTKSDQCKLCPMGFYCPQEAAPGAASTAVALPNVVRCPENEFTASRGASSRTDCACAVGFKLTEHEATAKCLPCAVGERCQGGSVLEIECHLENKAINADHSACVCEAGFGLVDFECQQCPPGFIKPVIGDTPCVPCGINKYAVNSTGCAACPMHAQARPGSASCSCAAPYALQDGVCALCPANHFWTPLANGAGSCAACPAESSSAPSPTMSLGPSACRCSRGHHATPSMASGTLMCRACAAGYFEEDGSCLSCPPGSSSPSSSHSIAACVCNPAVNSSTCDSLRVDRSCAGACPATPQPCAACTPGHYKQHHSTPGNTERCLACAEGEYQPGKAAVSCISCPRHEWHRQLAATALSQCLCVSGWTRAGNSSCSACTPGFYKDWLGNEVCAPCTVGRYNPDSNATVCHFCSDASLELLVAAGSTRPVLESNTTANEASVSVLDCVCARGHEPLEVGADLHCRPCARGTFKENTDHSLCAYCGALNTDQGSALLHHYGASASGAVAHSHCLECPLFSGQDNLVIGPGLAVMDELDDCKCFPGHENLSSTGCSPCPEYMVQTSYSDDACTFCAAGHYFVERHTPCAACYLADDGGAPHELLLLNRNDPRLHWGVDAGDCICRLGYQRDATDICRACPAGQFRGSNGTRWCAQCPADTFQDATAAHDCHRCPPDSSTLLATGQAAVQGCVCAAGFQQLQHEPSSNAFVCLPCAAGTYRTSRLAHESEQACVLCPADHYCPPGAVHPSPCPAGELALPGASDIDHCLCPSGSGRLPGPAHAPHDLSNPCILCAHAFFAPTNSNAPCAPCPAHKNTSAPGATALANCTCVPGHGVAHSTQHASHDAFLAAACAPCNDGFFAPGGRSAPCTHCGWGAVTEPASAASSASNCQCNAQAGLHKGNTL